MSHEEETEQFPAEIAENILRQLQEGTGHEIAGFIVAMWDTEAVPGRFGVILDSGEAYEMERELVDRTLMVIARHFEEESKEEK